MGRASSGGAGRVRLFDRFEWRREEAGDGAITLTMPNGAVSELRHGGDGVVLRTCSSGTREWLQYDHEGRLEGRMTARRGPHGEYVGWGARYAYSGEGDLLSVSDSARGVTLYEVDEAHRLVGMTASGNEPLSVRVRRGQQLGRAQRDVVAAAMSARGTGQTRPRRRCSSTMDGIG